MKPANFSDLLRKTLVSVDGAKGEDCINFITSTGEKYQMFHQQDCCEDVYVEDICGEWGGILGEPILQAEESRGNYTEDTDYRVSNWTFYRLATNKGSVVIRWMGISNGYYSTAVSFFRVN